MTNAQAEARALLDGMRKHTAFLNSQEQDAIVDAIATALAAKNAELEKVKAECDKWREAFGEMHRQTMRAEAQLAEARKALDLFEHYGCPICHGDCSSANPPVDCCPMEASRRAREGGRVDG